MSVPLPVDTSANPQPFAGHPAAPRRAVRVGIVGAGAVVRHFHRPVLRELARRGEVEVVGVADLRVEAARRVALPHRWPVVRGLEEVLAAGAELVLLAGPPGVRREQALAAIAARRHVLAEKPLAGTAEDAIAMVAAAAQAGVVLATGHYRRFLGGFERAGEWLRSGLLGRCRSIDIAEGGPFDWPVSAAFFDPKLTPGGVWDDMGVHILDQLLAWFGEPEGADYRDDAAVGGQEANAWAQLRWKDGLEARIHCSRDWQTGQEWRLNCERGALRIAIDRPAEVQVHWRDENAPDWTVAGPRPGEAGPAEPQAAALTAQWRNVLDAVRGRAEVRVTGREGAAAVAWTARLRGQRRPVRLPWDTGLGRIWEGVPGPVAVIGASGFIGSHLVAGMVAAGVEVRPVVRAPKSLARIARWPLECRIADPADPRALAEALRGCESVVYAAIGDANGLVRQARALGRAARAANLGRIVYLSSAMVHGPRPAEGTDESSPLRTGHPSAYADARVRAEAALRKAWGGDDGLVLLRPGVVLGARSRWITDLAAALRSGRAAWLDDGSGVCDAVAVENLAAAVAAGLRSEAAAGAFHIADAEPVTWRELYAAVAAAVGLPLDSVAEVSDRTVVPPRGRWWAERVRPELSRVFGPYVPGRLKLAIKAALAAGSGPPPADRFGWANEVRRGLDDELLLLQGARWRLPSARARRELGWSPVVTFAEGLERALAWHAVSEGCDVPEAEEPT